MPAMTLKSNTLTNTKLIMWHGNVFKATFAFISEKVVLLQRFHGLIVQGIERKFPKL